MELVELLIRKCAALCLLLDLLSWVWKRTVDTNCPTGHRVNGWWCSGAGTVAVGQGIWMSRLMMVVRLDGKNRQRGIAL